MPEAVCRMLTLLCPLVVACPIGTNLGLLHLRWMLASGRLLGARGALFPGLADCGRSVPSSRKSVRDGPSPQGILGAAAYPCHARHTHDPCRGILSYRKLED